MASLPSVAADEQGQPGRVGRVRRRRTPRRRSRRVELADGADDARPRSPAPDSGRAVPRSSSGPPWVSRLALACCPAAGRAGRRGWSPTRGSLCVNSPSSPFGSVSVWSAPLSGPGREQELPDVRRRRADDGRVAERAERHEEAVELAAPVEHAVAAGVGDQHVQAVAAVGEVAVGERRRVGLVVQPAGGVVVVVGVDAGRRPCRRTAGRCRCRRPASRGRGRRRAGPCRPRSSPPAVGRRRS